MRLLPRFSLAAIAALAVLATASAGVNTPQSGWYSGNPLLGPNSLRDTASAGSTCYAAGPGTIARTDDGAVSWTPVATTTYIVNRLTVGDSTTLYAGGQTGFLSKSVDAGHTWTTARMNGPLTNDIIDMACGDALHC